MSEVGVIENKLRNFMADKIMEVAMERYLSNNKESLSHEIRLERLKDEIESAKKCTPEKLLEMYGWEIFEEGKNLFDEYNLEKGITFKSGDKFIIRNAQDEDVYMVLWTGESEDDLRGVVNLSYGSLAFNNNDFFTIDDLMSEFVFNYGEVRKIGKGV